MGRHGKEWIVYQAINRVNGKRYVGMTGYSLASRRAGHKGQAADPKMKRTYFRNALRNHGIDAFEFSVLSRVADRDGAAREEIRLIALLQPEYNMTAGGDMPSSTPDGMRKIRAALDRSCASRKTRVICLSDGRIFASSAEAAEHYGISRAMICVVLKGKRATAKDLFFSYYTGDERILPDPVGALRLLRRAQKEEMLSKTPRRSVRCLDDGRIFSSIRAAAEEYGIKPGTLYHTLRGQAAHAGGLRFVYCDTERESDVKRPMMTRTKKGWKPINCISDGKRFASATGAEAFYELYPGAVSRAALANATTRGLRFKYEELA